jgi:formylglycine-generating enzyme required for sulfatase activity
MSGFAMAEKFDPYYEWLGIPADEQPPNHYRLLGIQPLETSASVIENAANQRMGHLRTFQTGKHSADSQRLLNEVAAARICLLKPEKKAAYDDELRKKLAPKQGFVVADAIDAGLSEIFQTPPAIGGSIIPRNRDKKPARLSLPVVAAIIAGVAAVVSLGLWLVFSQGGKPSEKQTADAGVPKADESAAGPRESASSLTHSQPRPSASVAASSVVTSPTKELTAAEPKTSGSQTARAKNEVSTVSSPAIPAQTSKTMTVAAHIAAPKAEPPASSETASDPSLAERALPSEENKAAKLAAPSAEQQQKLIAEMDEIYKPGDTKDQAAREALARKLLEEGQKDETNHAEQFVFLRRAAEVARDAYDVDLTMQAIDAIAARFDIRPFQVKARFLKQLLAKGSPNSAAQVLAINAACVTFSEAAIADDATAEASEVLDAAGKLLAKLVAQSQAAQRAAKSAVLHARSPAEKAEREKTAADAEEELDAIKTAQHALAECVKTAQQARREHEMVRSAEERLKADPEDAAACLKVGRWYCFDKGNWEDGLKLLAKGTDPVLNSLAMGDSAAKTSTAQDMVTRGDAWWDAAEKATGKTKSGMRLRAAHWYKEALPNTPSGLEKMKLDNRLAQAAEEPVPETFNRSQRLSPPLAIAPFDEKTARQHQARWAKYLGTPVVQTNSIGMKLVLIPPGEFEMGSRKEVIDDEIAKGYANESWFRSFLLSEGPAHRVRITRPYWLGATDVTQEQYLSVMEDNPSNFQGDPRRPVERVPWNDAVDFCRRLSALPKEKAAKRHYRLPTEAEWEYACRAGTTTRWYSGDDEAALTNSAWFEKNSDNATHPPGQKRSNAWGLYDMSGNVGQWCQDWYHEEYYKNSPKENPAGPAAGSSRVARGGASSYPAWRCRSAHRDARDPRNVPDIGMRVVLEVAEQRFSKSSGIALPPREITVTIPANSAVGYELGSVRKGSTITLQYVEGKWKAWGRVATENPDAEQSERGDRCRLAIVELSADRSEGTVLQVVPAGTAEKPFAWRADRTYRDLALRINDSDPGWDKKPGAVQYKVLISP